MKPNIRPETAALPPEPKKARLLVPLDTRSDVASRRVTVASFLPRPPQVGAHTSAAAVAVAQTGAHAQQPRSSTSSSSRSRGGAGPPKLAPPGQGGGATTGGAPAVTTTPGAAARGCDGPQGRAHLLGNNDGARKEGVGPEAVGGSTTSKSTSTARTGTEGERSVVESGSGSGVGGSCAAEKSHVGESEAPTAAASGVPPAFADLFIRIQNVSQVHHTKLYPAVPADFCPIPPDLHGHLALALKNCGFGQLFRHQVETWSACKKGLDVVVITPTSSGKSLCFNMATFDMLLASPQHRTALYLFPLNALLKDQENNLHQLNNTRPLSARFHIATIIGGTTLEEREKIFSSGIPPDIVITNPDMLHHLLKNSWRGWKEFLRCLHIIILDEAHSYTGIFGTNVSNVIRRLYLSIQNCGGDPQKLQFIIATATVANAPDMCFKLTNRHSEEGRLHTIMKSGASSPCRGIVVLAPSSDFLHDGARIAAEWALHRCQGIIFCNTLQQLAELASVFSQKFPKLSVKCFHAGIDVTSKQTILENVRTGSVQILIATNALEAGVDIPALDCCLLMGYPGSRVSLKQRVGRAGRREPGLAIYLPNAECATDCFFATNPEAMWDGNVEAVIFNPDYPTIVRMHLWCASAEQGITREQVEQLFGARGLSAFESLVDKLYAVNLNGTVIWRSKEYPHKLLSVRGSDSSKKQVQVVISCGGNLEPVSVQHALLHFFPGATHTVYSQANQSKYYRVTSLDIDSDPPTAMLTAITATEALASRQFPIIDRRVASTQPWQKKRFLINHTANIKGELHIELGWGTVTTTLHGYKVKSTAVHTKTNKYSHPHTDSYDTPYLRVSYTEAAGLYLQSIAPVILAKYNDIVSNGRSPNETNNLIPSSTPLKSAIEFARSTLKKWANAFGDFRTCVPVEACASSSLHTLLHQLVNVASLHMLSTNDANDTTIPPCSAAAFLVDAYENGTGACEGLFTMISDVIKTASRLTESCKHCGGYVGCTMCVSGTMHCSSTYLPLIPSLGASVLCNLSAL
ncbi:DEAD/DEAH box helicase [Pelomyxa schiedti]|nr:DEAD/DEAH box helicase [Pelomyxa schiedti]